MIDFMVFSRNRALQLYALLESIEKYIDKKHVSVSVLHRYDDEHIPGLEEIKDRFSTTSFIEESNFKQHVTNFLETGSKFCAFLTDDIIFKDSVDVGQVVDVMENNTNVLTFSLRLGLHIKDCYALSSEQPVPMGNVYPPNLFVWDWRQAKMDWEYPLSVDGHIFRREQISKWFKPLEYKHPNSFEEIIQVCRKVPDIPPLAVSFVTSRLVNLPINRVQDTHTNRCGDVSSDFLLGEWNQGKKISISKFHQLLNTGVHQELDITYEDRHGST